jgi:hypothetical protein
VERGFDSGPNQSSTGGMRALVEIAIVGPVPRMDLAHSLTRPGCHPAPGFVVRRCLEQVPNSCGSEGNSCLYLLVKVVSHSVCISLQGPQCITKGEVIRGVPEILARDVTSCTSVGDCA